MKKIIICVFLVIFLLPTLIGQTTCQFTLKGRILDEATRLPLAFANVYLEENKLGALTQDDGSFVLKNICKGSYHLNVSHIGCETNRLFITISSDTTLQIQLHHHAELLNEVVVHAEGGSANSATVKRETITQQSNKTLAEVLSNVSGVSLLKTGNGITKPILHGLYGNRITILNNGIAQGGQQWGNDHAPEIDPFVANHLSVVKGASALVYGGSTLGGVVMVEPAPATDDPHFHGELNYAFQTNGLGHTFNARAEQAAKWASWRVFATLKNVGDAKTPDYFLTNTGKREGNFALQIDKKWRERWHANLYYSLFNTEIGILRGAQVGSLDDLKEAIGRDVPFYTNDFFSYKIDAPRQVVQHHLLKVEAKHFSSKGNVLSLRYGGQVNDRQEFDRRRSGRSSVPSLSLLQLSQYLEAQQTIKTPKKQLLKTGVQLQFTDNTNRPETGILPLIPDYIATQAAVFGIFSSKESEKKIGYELGLRYDFKHFNVATISTTLPRRIEYFTHFFHNLSGLAAFDYKVKDNLKTSLQLGYALRAPEVNELYSFGLHQGVSSIEEGNRNLRSEQSAKAVFSVEWEYKSSFFVQAVVYGQHINNYIYLKPQNEPRLTIRGAFPVFVYEQTRATLAGADVLLSWSPRSDLKTILKYAFVRGNDLRNARPLVFMPSDNISVEGIWSLPSIKKLKENFISLQHKYIFKQTRLLPEQDFLPPPSAYALFALSAGTSLPFSDESRLRFSIQADNILNRKYRDYLDRQRYFADSSGANWTIRFNYAF